MPRNPYGFTEEELESMRANPAKQAEAEVGLSLPEEGGAPNVVAPTAALPEEGSFGIADHLGDIGVGIFTGVRQGVLNTVDGLLSLAELATQFVAQDDSIEFDKDISKAIRGGEQAFFDTVTFGATEGVTPETEAETFAGGLAKGLSQFLVGFIGPSKFLKAAKFGGAIVRGALAGGVADFFAFGAHEKRLSDFIQQYPDFRNPVTEFLAVKDDDSEAFGRLKNVVEGGLLGIGTEGAIALTTAFMRSMKVMKSGIKARNGLEALHPAEAEQVLKEAEQLAGAVQDESISRAVALEDTRLTDEIVAREVPVEGDINPLAAIENARELEDLKRHKAQLPEVEEILKEGKTNTPNLPHLKMNDEELTAYRNALQDGDLEMAYDLLSQDWNPAGFDSVETFISIGAMAEINKSVTASMKGGIKETWDQVLDQSSKILGQGREKSLQVMKDLYGETTELSAKFHQSHVLMQTMHRDVMAITKALDLKSLGDITDQQMADWIRAANNAGEVQAMLTGVKTNIGRALNSMKMGKSASEALAEVKVGSTTSATPAASVGEFIERSEIKISRADVDDAPLTTKSGETVRGQKSSAGQSKDVEFEASVARNPDGSIDSVTLRSKDGKIEVDVRRRFQSDLKGAPVNETGFVFDVIKKTGKNADGGLSKQMKAIVRKLKEEIPGLDELTKKAKELDPEGRPKKVDEFEGIHLSAQKPKKRPRSSEKLKTELEGAKPGPVPRFTVAQRARTNADLIAAHGGRKRLKTHIRALAVSDHLGVSGKNMRLVHLRQDTNLTIKMFINNILSGPRTFARNFISNTGMLLAAPSRDLLIGVVNDMFIHNGDGLTTADALAEFGELFSSLYDAMLMGGRYMGIPTEAKMSGGLNPLSIGVEAARTGRSQMIPGGNSIFETIADVGAGTGLVHQTFELSGKGLLGADEFFKAINYRMEMKRLARKEAKAANRLSDPEWIENIIANPSDDMVDGAINAMERNTFTQPLGDWGKKIQSLTQGDSNIAKSLKFVIPFIRTPTNILKEVGKSTPLAWRFSQEVQASIARGGVDAQRAIAQMALGSAAMVGVMGLVKAGLVTGGGPQEWRSQLDAGRQRYSIVIPDGEGGELYFQYDRIEPFGVVLGIAADIAEASGDMSAGDLGVAISTFTTSFMKLTLDRSYLSGIAQIMTLIEDTKTDTPQTSMRKWAKYAADVATAIVVPFSSALNQIGQGIDPILRENRTLMDRFMSKIPGLSFTLPPRLNIFGEISKMPYGYGIGIVNPIGVTRGSKDPVKLFMADLPHDIRMPDRSISTIELDSEQYNDYIKMMNIKMSNGLTMKGEIGKLIKSRSFLSLPDNAEEGAESRTFAIERIVLRRKARARRALLRKYPKLQHSVRLHKLNERRAQRGLVELPDVNSRASIVEALNLF